MDILGQLTIRAFAILVGAWIGVSTVWFIAFLWYSAKRGTQKITRRNWTRTNCPYCDGRGAVIDRFDEWAICPMCDGDRELAAPRELDAG